MINDGPAVLVEHRPEWSASAEQLLDDLRVALSTAAFEEPTAWSVDHIGSTSVPGLAAKNIIDLQIRLRVLPDDNALRGLLAPFGYLPSAGSRPDSPGVTRDDPCGDVSLPDEVWDKRLFVRPDSGQQVVLHVRRSDSPFGWHTVWFRNWLRAHPSERDRYEAVKRRLADEHASDADYDDYTRGKSCYFADVRGAVEAWGRR